MLRLFLSLAYVLLGYGRCAVTIETVTKEDEISLRLVVMEMQMITRYVTLMYYVNSCTVRQK